MKTIMKFFNWCAHYQFLNVDDTRDSNMKYNIWFDSKFGNGKITHIKHILPLIKYKILPKLYIEIESGCFLPIFFTLGKTRAFTIGKLKNNNDVQNIINAINKRIVLIQMYFADKYSDVLYDDLFYILLDNMHNDTLSNLDILKIMISEAL